MPDFQYSQYSVVSKNMGFGDWQLKNYGLNSRSAIYF